MEGKKRTKIIIRVLLTTLTAAFVAWIFSNSLQVAVESAEQSDSFTQMVQNFFKIIAPNSFIATATGADFDRLEAVVRTLAHFCEFALLGALAFWTYRAYTPKKIWMIAPFVGGALVAVIDEILQYFTPGRAFQITDVLVDCAGVCAGCLFALATVAIALRISKKRKEKRRVTYE